MPSSKCSKGLSDFLNFQTAGIPLRAIHFTCFCNACCTFYRINDYLSQVIRIRTKRFFYHFDLEKGSSKYKSIPKNWQVYLLSDLVKTTNGYSYTSQELGDNSSTALVTIKNFDRSGGFETEGYKPLIPEKGVKTGQYLDLFDLVVAHTDLTQAAEVIGNSELILSKGSFTDLIMSMDLVKVESVTDDVNVFILAALLSDARFKNHALGYVNGTTVLHLSKKCIPNYRVTFPKDLSLLAPIGEELRNYYDMISLNLRENLELMELRDYLIPRMMSGKLNISNRN
ncbi:MAG: restriction endonuclease subunit S [Candidatus Methanomethylophilaceae archaeon]